MKPVTFVVDGVEVAADLYVPSDLAAGERRPALVLLQGFGAVKEFGASQGVNFSKAGYICLAIDYRTFGASGGRTRGELFPLKMVEDARAAISYLQTLPQVEADRIGVWGTSFGGAIALAAGALDRRARVTIAQVPIVDGRRWMRGLRTAEQWENMLDILEEDRRRRFMGEPSARIPLARHWTSAEFSAMPTEESVVSYMSILEKTVPGWKIDIAMESVEKVIEFNPLATITQIGPRPLCIVVTTGFEPLHPTDQILDAYNRAHEPKRLVSLPYDQLGLYSEPGASHAVTETMGFLEQYLPVGRTVGGAVPRSRFVP
jgi:acetyl esterase/lipase